MTNPNQFKPQAQVLSIQTIQWQANAQLTDGVAQQAQEPPCAPHFCNTCDGTGETPQECHDCDGHGYHIKPVASPARNVEAVDGGRWYCVSNDGGATLCASQDEAVGLASTGNFLFPNQSPHVARKMQTATNAALQEENDRLKKELEAVGAGGVQAMVTSSKVSVGNDSSNGEKYVRVGDYGVSFFWGGGGGSQPKPSHATSDAHPEMVKVEENLGTMVLRLAHALQRNITTQDKDMSLVKHCMAWLKDNGLDGALLRDTDAPEKLAQGAPDEGTPASRLLQEARQYWSLANAKHPGAVQWIENKESGEFLIFTRGEYRERLLRGIGEINDGEDARNQALAECRDAFPAPAPGSSLEPHWQAAMAAPRFVPVYLRAIAAQHTAHDAMGIPKSCGRPLCSDSQHHPLCRMSEQSIAAAEWMKLRERVARVGGRENAAGHLEFNGYHAVYLLIKRVLIELGERLPRERIRELFIAAKSKGFGFSDDEASLYFARSIEQEHGIIDKSLN